MYTSNSSRPVIQYAHTSVKRDVREPQWWMRAQSRGMMYSDKGASAACAQSGDF